MYVSYRYGCILQIKDVDAIVHQCNCLTVKSHGLSQKISECFPWGDIYRRRTPVRGRNLAVTNHHGKPGTIQILKSPEENTPDIICLLSQWDFGRGGIRKIPPYEDSASNRELWFFQSLQQLKQTSYKRLAFPYKIGCGLAGGKWEVYLDLICKFTYSSGKDVIIIIPSVKVGCHCLLRFLKRVIFKIWVFSLSYPVSRQDAPVTQVYKKSYF